MTGVCINKENLDIKIETYTGKSPHRDEDRDQADASASQGTPKSTNKPPQARREACNGLITFLTAIGRNDPENTFILDF